MLTPKASDDRPRIVMVLEFGPPICVSPHDNSHLRTRQRGGFLGGFQRLVKHLRTCTRGAWADLALEFGFYDQAHLVKEVRQFTGLTPSEARPLVTDLHSLFS